MFGRLACWNLKVLQEAMQTKNLSLLTICQGLMVSSISLTIATSALVGVVLAPTPALATLPIGLTYTCMMLMMIPASLFMRRYGRRAGFSLGGCAGMIGGATSAVAIYNGSFLLFCIGSTIFGISSGFGQYYRFAAAEVVDESYKSRAISWVLMGGLVAAFIGPNAANLTRDLIPDALFSASYALVVLFSFGVVIAQFFIRIPKPSIEESQGHKRSLQQILTSSTFLVAALCAMVAYGVMNLLMTATPLAMLDRHMPFSDTVMVIQWHIVGMFAPSFFTGSLIDRFGVLKIMFTGALILLVCAIVALLGQLYSYFIVGLVMLGIGWNFLYLGATTLLTESHLPAEKGVVQGVNEFLVFSITTLTAFASGYFYYQFGWEILNYFTIPVVSVTACIIILFGWSQYRN